MRWRKELTCGLAASALVHAAAFGALIAWTGVPAPTAVFATIPITFVFEPASGIAADSAEPAATISRAATPPISPEPLAEPVPPAPQAAAVAAAPTAQPIVIPPTRQRPRPPRPRPDTTATATLAQPASPARPPGTAEAAMSTAAFPSQANGSGPSGSGGGTTPAAATSPSYLSPAYLATVVSWLEQHKEYPDAARSRHDEGTVQIAFTIDRDGHVLSFEIRHSSGNAMLDQAAKDMIRRADPLPPPPASYLGPRLEMVLPLTFALR